MWRRSVAAGAPRSLAVLITLLVAACSAARRDPTAGEIMVAVENDLLPRADLTIRVESEGGFRRILGGVGPGATRTLRFREPSYGGRFRLIARTPDGGEIASVPFSLFPGAIVSWSIRDNALSVERYAGAALAGVRATSSPV